MALTKLIEPHLVNRTMLSNAISNALLSYLPLDGGTLTGRIHILDGVDVDEPATIGQLNNVGGDYLLGVRWNGSRSYITSGYLPVDGQLVLRSMYADAFAAIQAGQYPVVSDASWLADTSLRGCFSLGDGVTTFRLPDLNGKHPTSLGRIFLSGDGKGSAAVEGHIQGDAIRNITGSYVPVGGKSIEASKFAGAFAEETTSLPIGTWSLGASSPIKGANFSADRVVPTGDENRPRNVTGCIIIKMFGTITNQGALDAATLAQAITTLSSKVLALETTVNNIGKVLYLFNGNTPAIPSVIGTNARIVLPNPFGTREFHAVAEVENQGKWGECGWLYVANVGSTGAVAGSMLETSTGKYFLILQTGTQAVITNSAQQGGVIGNTGTTALTTAPIRIKCWTVDKG